MDPERPTSESQSASLDIAPREQAEEAPTEAYDDLERPVVASTVQLQETNKSLQEELAECRRMEQALRENEGHMRVPSRTAGDSIRR